MMMFCEETKITNLPPRSNRTIHLPFATKIYSDVCPLTLASLRTEKKWDDVAWRSCCACVFLRLLASCQCRGRQFDLSDRVATCGNYDDYGWESLFKKVRFWVQIASFFISYGLQTIFANKYSIPTWMTREWDEQTALFWMHISMRTIPRASKLIFFKFIAKLKEFTRFVSQFVTYFQLGLTVYLLLSCIHVSHFRSSVSILDLCRLYSLICQSLSFSRR